MDRHVQIGESQDPLSNILPVHLERLVNYHWLVNGFERASTCLLQDHEIRMAQICAVIVNRKVMLAARRDA